MKRFVCLLLALGMIFSLCACGKEEIKKEEIKPEDLIGTYANRYETLDLRSDGECFFGVPRTCLNLEIGTFQMIN